MDMRRRKVLVVEDDYLQAQEIVAFFRTSGADVLGPALTLNAAMQHSFRAEAAILDLDIAGRSVFPVAEALAQRGVPFVFYTGLRRDLAIPARFRHVEVIFKPVSIATLGEAFERVLEREVTTEESVEKMLPLLRVWSRLVVNDAASADRLVERTLVEAISSLQRGETLGASETQVDWLLRKLELVLERDGPDLLN